MRKKQIAIAIICVVVLSMVTCIYLLSRNYEVSMPEVSKEIALESKSNSQNTLSQEEISDISSALENTFSGLPDSNEQLSDPDAEKVLATLGTIGDNYTLHARQYQQGEAQEEDTPSLGWDGDMTLLIRTASVTPYEESGEYGENDPRGIWPLYAENFQDPCVLRLEMSLENIDAHNRTGVQYQFSASMFYLSGYEDLIPQNWQSENYANVTQRYTAMESYFDKNSGTKDYWSFELQPGETMDFVLEFLVDREYFEQQSPFLAVSLSREIKAGILLDDIMEG